MTGFAARATWLFGNAAGMLEYGEVAPSRCVARRALHEPAAIRLRFDCWDRPIARAEGTTRHLDFRAANGSPIAAVKLDGVDADIDELLWLLASDAPPQHRLPPPSFHRGCTAHDLRNDLRIVERRCDFDRIVAERGATRGSALTLAGPHVATPLPADAVSRAMLAAAEAGIPLRVRFENAGGDVTWAPAMQDVLIGSDYIELRSPFGRAHLGKRVGPSWLVHLATDDSGGPSIEGESPADGGWIRVDVMERFAARPAWRRICHALL